MNSNAMKVVAAGLVVLAIILVIFAYRLSRNYASEAQRARQALLEQTHPATSQVSAVVAVKPLAANQADHQGRVEVLKVPVAPKDHYGTLDEVVGKTPLVDVDAGTPLVPRLFRQASLLARDIPPGDQAVSLKVDDVIGVGGFVRPGDVVDVLVYLSGNSGLNGKVPQQARVLLRNAVVLSYQDLLIPPPEGLKDKKKKDNNYRHERTAVLAVPEDDVTRVMLGASMGQIRLALHPLPAQTACLQAPAAGASAAPPAAAGSAAVTADAASGCTPASAATVAPAVAASTDNPITADELARIKPLRRKGAPPPPPSVIIYRGDKVSRVHP
jgi:Flp pilus assembly protein CpaB